MRKSGKPTREELDRGGLSTFLRPALLLLVATMPDFAIFDCLLFGGDDLIDVDLQRVVFEVVVIVSDYRFPLGEIEFKLAEE